MKISKEAFINVIEDLKESNDYQKNLNKFFKNNNVDGYIYQPDCSCSVVKLLHIIFENSDADEWISFFCFDLDFGRKWKPGIVTAKDGSTINIATAEELYDYLTGLE